MSIALTRNTFQYVGALTLFTTLTSNGTASAQAGGPLIDALSDAGIFITELKGGRAPSVVFTMGPGADSFRSFASEIDANLNPMGGILNLDPDTGVPVWWQGSVTAANGGNEIAFATSSNVAVTASCTCPKGINSVYTVAIGTSTPNGGGVSAEARNLGKKGSAEAVGPHGGPGDQAGGDATAEAEDSTDATGGNGSGNKSGGDATARSEKGKARADAGNGTGTSSGDGGDAEAISTKGELAIADAGNGAPATVIGGRGGNAAAFAPHGFATATAGQAADATFHGGLGGSADASGKDAEAFAGSGGNSTAFNGAGGNGGNAQALAAQSATAKGGHGGNNTAFFGFGGSGGNATTCGKTQEAVPGEPGDAAFPGSPGVASKC